MFSSNHQRWECDRGWNWLVVIPWIIVIVAIIWIIANLLSSRERSKPKSVPPYRAVTVSQAESPSAFFVLFLRLQKLPNLFVC